MSPGDRTLASRVASRILYRMGYRSLQQLVLDLESSGHLVRLTDEVDARLEAAEIHRRVYRAGGPAILFQSVRGCRFPMLSNVFGTYERACFIFRDTLKYVRRLVELKTDGARFWKRPAYFLRALPTAANTRPVRRRHGPVLAETTTVSDLPQLVSWPDDGGAFITLPQVYTEHPDHPGLANGNLGMYRVQLSGGQYRQNEEVGLHYQIHRGIGVHHQAAIRTGQPLRVNIFVGGTPAMTLAAVMPLPEGMSELTFAGALAGHRIPMIDRPAELPRYAEADFCISGVVDPDKMLPEGPFGDHLGYYSLAHEFPVLRVDRVTCRRDAIWPFTVVGRPPQEDTVFGKLIHELTGPVIPTVIPGVRAVHAVDASGVHPLLLAIGSERYTPYRNPGRPQELLTQASAILGQGQMSLAKFVMIVNHDDDPQLDIHDVTAFLRHLLERVDFERDLHFHTRTTIDTLDYSGSGLNEGSKLVMAASGPPIRSLATELPAGLTLPDQFDSPRMCFPGVMAVRGPGWVAGNDGAPVAAERLAAHLGESQLAGIPWCVVVDDVAFVGESINNFLWVVFTRTNPAPDIHGCHSFVRQKHWGCRGSLVIDARIKSHHAPPLVEDPAVGRRVDALAARGGPLAQFL